jgi:hypothetical protein
MIEEVENYETQFEPLDKLITYKSPKCLMPQRSERCSNFGPAYTSSGDPP